MRRKKILFLDIDGVLNHAAWFKDRAPRPRLDTFEADLQHAVDPRCLASLNLVIAQARPKVVLSSAWRHLAPWQQTYAVLRAMGFRGEMIGRTPLDDEVDRRIYKRYHGHLPRFFEPYPRGYEIQQWLESHGRPVTFAIVDDDPDMMHLSSRFVQTDFDDGGLTDQHARSIVALLNR